MERSNQMNEFNIANCNHNQFPIKISNGQSNKSLSAVKVLSVDSLSPLGEQETSLGKNIKI
jgi:hypothetical protein